MKIFVAIPTYDGRLDGRLVSSLLSEQLVASKLGYDFEVRILAGCSHAAMGRNQLAKEFLDSDFDRLFFLDSDITWEPGSIIKLSIFPHEIVGGCYRHKLQGQPESYPIGWLPDPEGKGLFGDQFGLTEVAALPGGFMSIRRSVFEKMIAKNPEKTFEHMGRKFHCFFEMRFEDGKLWGEDTKFCEDWRALGGRVFLDPSLTLTHWNFVPTPFEGCIGNWVRKVSPYKPKENQAEVSA